MSINKLFSNLGICSRKETNRLIEENRVLVNGKIPVTGQWIAESDIVFLDGKPVTENEKIYLAFYKPKGIVCTNSKDVDNNIIDYINYNKYIFPVGRLDKDSEGLIVLTNDGEFANKLINCEAMHEKEYIVTLDKDIDEKFIEKMSQGVFIKNKESSGLWRVSDTVAVKKTILHNGNIEYKEEILKEAAKEDRKNRVKTRPCKVEIINRNTFRITLTQGLNRQIRKMCGSLGFNVISLKRIRISNIMLNNLKAGETRKLNEEEIKIDYDI